MSITANPNLSSLKPGTVFSWNAGEAPSYHYGVDEEARVDREFGDWMGRERRSQGMTIPGAARKSGISYGRWRDLENGAERRSVTRGELERIAETFKVPYFRAERYASEGTGKEVSA